MNCENWIEKIFGYLGKVPKKYADQISGILGSFWFWVDKKHRNIANDNLTRAFGSEKTPDEIHELARRVFIHLIRMIFDIGWYFNVNVNELDRHFRINGGHHLSSAYARKQGVLVLTAHIGNWELLPVLAPLLNLNANILYRPMDFGPLDDYFVRSRTRMGLKAIPTAHSMRKIIRALKDGELVAMLMDQNVDWYEGVFTDFFGQPACTNKGLALIAMKTGCPVVPVFMLKHENGFVAEIMPEIRRINTGDKIRDVEENTRQYNHAIENIVRKYPDQWFWVHQRWKTKAFCNIQ